MRLGLGKCCGIFAKRVKTKLVAAIGVALVGVAVLTTSGCNQIMGISDDEIKKTVLELANQMVQENSMIPKTVRAVEVRGMSLAQDSFSKRVGYADVVFRSQSTGKTDVLRYNVKVTGFIFDDKLVEIQLRNPVEGFKLFNLNDY